MIQSVFENKARMWQYIIFIAGFAVLQALALVPLLNVSTLIVISASVLLSVLYAAIGIMLVLTLKFGKFGNLPDFQRVINYSALILLSVSVSVAGGYGLIWLILGENISVQFMPVLSINGFISLLFYLLMIVIAQLLKTQTKQTVESVTMPAEKIVTDIEQVKDTEILERIAVKSGQKIHVIMVPEIVYLQADGDYVLIYTMQGKYLKEQTMKYFEEHLPSAGFVRVHRSCIVNVEAISRIDLYEKQTQQLTLKNGHQIKVSQTGYKLLRSKLSL